MIICNLYIILMTINHIYPYNSQCNASGHFTFLIFIILSGDSQIMCCINQPTTCNLVYGCNCGSFYYYYYYSYYYSKARVNKGSTTNTIKIIEYIIYELL